jgi:hypothetical protein
MLLNYHDRWASLNKNENLDTDVNLTWLQAAVRKFNSRTDMSGIWLEAQYSSYRILFPISNGYLHALISSAV